MIFWLCEREAEADSEFSAWLAETCAAYTVEDPKAPRCPFCSRTLLAIDSERIASRVSILKTPRRTYRRSRRA